MSRKATSKSKRTKRLRASYAVADELGVKIIEDRMLEPWGLQGQWEGGRTITINPRIASNYTVLHEIGHVLCGYGCCREHDEFKAYGVAIGLAKAYGIRLTRKALGSVDLYDGTSTRMACGIRSTRRGSRGATSRDQKRKALRNAEEPLSRTWWTRKSRCSRASRGSPS